MNEIYGRPVQSPLSRAGKAREIVPPFMSTSNQLIHSYIEFPLDSETPGVT